MDLPAMSPSLGTMRAFVDYYQFGDGVRIWLYFVGADGKPTHIVLPTDLVVRTYDHGMEGGKMAPALELPYLQAADLLAAIQSGIQRLVPTTDAHLKGLVEAKEANLVDLRNILRKKGLMT
jgi:hypothetical protein